MRPLSPPIQFAAFALTVIALTAAKAEDLRTTALHRRCHDRVRRLGLDVGGRLGLWQRKRRIGPPHRQGANGDAGNSAERDPLSPGRTDHLRLRRLEPMHYPSRAQAGTECRRSHHGGDRRLETRRQNAAHRLGRPGGRCARLPQQAWSHRGPYRWRGDLRRIALRHVGEASCRSQSADGQRHRPEGEELRLDGGPGHHRRQMPCRKEWGPIRPGGHIGRTP